MAVGTPRGLALVGAALVLVSHGAEVAPYPLHLTTVICLVGGALATKAKRGPLAAAVTGLTLLVAGYTRPEYVPAFLLFCLAGLAAGAWAVRRGAVHGWQIATAGAVLGAATGGMLAVFGNPLVGKFFWSWGSQATIAGSIALIYPQPNYLLPGRS